MKNQYEVGVRMLDAMLNEGAELDYDGQYWCLYGPHTEELIASGETITKLIMSVVESVDKAA